MINYNKLINNLLLSVKTTQNISARLKLISIFNLVAVHLIHYCMIQCWSRTYNIQTIWKLLQVIINYANKSDRKHVSIITKKVEFQ